MFSSLSTSDFRRLSKWTNGPAAFGQPTSPGPAAPARARRPRPPRRGQRRRSRRRTAPEPLRQPLRPAPAPIRDRRRSTAAARITIGASKITRRGSAAVQESKTAAVLWGRRIITPLPAGANRQPSPPGRTTPSIPDTPPPFAADYPDTRPTVHSLRRRQPRDLDAHLKRNHPEHLPAAPPVTDPPTTSNQPPPRPPHPPRAAQPPATTTRPRPPPPPAMTMTQPHRPSATPRRPHPAPPPATPSIPGPPASFDQPVERHTATAANGRPAPPFIAGLAELREHLAAVPAAHQRSAASWR